MASVGAATGGVTTAVRAAARAVGSAKGLLVTAGAGIGVDSGLPDFRGVEGLWKEYPPLKNKRLGFAEMASPRWFESDPNFAWGFYGHRLNLYRRTEPHVGFSKMLKWGGSCSFGVRVFTSNVDGQFQKAGYDSDDVVECHGSIHWLQDLSGFQVWSARDVHIPEVDAEVLLVPDDALPRCHNSREVARPNILMFGDGGWNGSRSGSRRRSLQQWLAAIQPEHLVVLELGAGNFVPTVRYFGEQLASNGSTLVRINPREAQGPTSVSHMKGKVISIPLGSMEALSLINSELQE